MSRLSSDVAKQQLKDMVADISWVIVTFLAVVVKSLSLCYYYTGSPVVIYHTPVTYYQPPDSRGIFG